MAKEPEEIAQEAVRNPSEEWFISILDGQQPADPEAWSKHLIPKAPTKFRKYEKDKKYFDPRVVSLGPYHRGKDDLKPMEKHKIEAVKRFIPQSTDGTVRGRIYEGFMKVVGVAKGYYAAEVVAHLTNDVFARMMFLDGCFVLHFIENFNHEEPETKLEISNDLIPLIIRDMFLMENQLPFEVLDALMKLRCDSVSSSEGKEKILEFINSEVLIPMGMFYPVRSSRSSKWCGENNRPLHLLDILRTILLDFPPSKGTKKKSYRRHNFGSVMELKETGIRFEERRMKSLMGIRYKENLLFPRLLLPTMYINDTTISQLLNLTALEACSDKYSGCGVTSFIHFMDSLINDGADVKKLRSKGILHHSLGSDRELARLFNKWPADVTNDLKLYRAVGKHIRRHRKRKVKISIATWLEKYFGSPWTAISFVAASLLLVLTVIQTYFTAFPRL